MPEASLLQPLINMAAFLLAVNLAYLRFETFTHRERIKKHALGQLGAVGDVPQNLKETNYFKRLSYWAGMSDDRKVAMDKLGWGRWYPLVFDTKRDRQASKLMICSALPVVLLGTVDATGLLRIPSQTEWIGWILAVLEVMTVASVMLVLGGNGYISKACDLIDDDAKQWKIVMRDKTPDVRTKPTNPSVTVPPTVRSLLPPSS